MSFKDLLIQLLKTDKRLLDSEGELMGNKIQDLADKTDENLITLLLEDSQTRAKFFLKIKEVYVFKTSDFKFYLDENKIDNSYTQYENRIGLTSKGKFLKDSNDIVLDFPYKDCVLEGGQSTEEGTDTYFEWDEKDQHYTEKKAKRKEIFFNSVLAKDEIDRLLEPKAFTNAKKYSPLTPKGETISEFERDDNDTIKDNLIIKGNNLLALHTLKRQFAGKVKLIYIDPPYNTGNDSFAYNDNFNHSTWLTFMRNRLLVAKELLREDGVMFLSLDDKEAHYCKVLMDSIFKRENFIADICHKSRGSISNDKIISPNHNHILLYAVNERLVFSKKDKFGIKKSLDSFKLKDEVGEYKLVPVDGPGGAVKGNPFYTFEGIEGYWRFSKERMQKMYDEGLVVRTKSGLQQKYYKDKAAKSKQTVSTWWDENFLTSSATSELKKLMNDDIFNNPKNTSLLKRIVELSTSENDIVLDYHAGSGTTAHAVLELNTVDNFNRQFIMIEQMDYAKNVTANRISKVIENNKKGSFVYLELAKNNQNAIEQIQNCKSYEGLTSFFEKMCEKYFLHYNVKVKQFREEICQEENFKKLSLDNQKELFIKMLDLNQLYVNVSDMEDKKYNLSEDDIAITKDFYQL